MSALNYGLLLLTGLVPIIPAVIYFRSRRRKDPVRATKGLLVGLGGVNVIIGLMALTLGILWLLTPGTVQADSTLSEVSIDPYASLAAALSTGVAAIASGVAVGNTGAAALGTIAEKPELFGRALIFVGLAEGIAIYGLLVSFLILNR